MSAESRKIKNWTNQLYIGIRSIDISSYFGETVDSPDEVKDPKFHERRRQAICYLFEAMGSPEESVWEGGGIVSDLMIRLNINHNSRSSVMAILRDVLKIS